jgi:hypothetical protein
MTTKKGRVVKRENSPWLAGRHAHDVATGLSEVVAACRDDRRYTKSEIESGVRWFLRGFSRRVFDRNAYQAAYMRDTRAAVKLGLTVAQYRAQKERM